MKIDINTPIEIDSFYMGMNEPDRSGDEIEVESSFCPLCGEGENHKDIKICKDCEDVFSPENQAWNALYEAERRMRRLQKIEFEVKSREL